MTQCIEGYVVVHPDGRTLGEATYWKKNTDPRQGFIWDQPLESIRRVICAQRDFYPQGTKALKARFEDGVVTIDDVDPVVL